jgi:hypothetical protein
MSVDPDPTQTAAPPGDVDPNPVPEDVEDVEDVERRIESDPSLVPTGPSRLLVAAAVLVLLAGGVGTAVWAGWGSDPVHTVAAGPVRMSVRALGDTAGTTLDVRVAGLPPRENCRLVVVDDAGKRHPAGEWLATYEGEASFRGWADVPRSQVTDLLLVDRAGATIVRVPL